MMKNAFNSKRVEERRSVEEYEAAKSAQIERIKRAACLLFLYRISVEM